ncbi:hypothetical protein [Hymenobacter metallicola]|uniref:Uncharacterized protein n=1 Tax=Hymenobacter metallicola TaxID=2563114 RepID=A0A4Z0QIE4_9BACT|nr:hypothetical protein [Hymenobacter metallicola]TGE29837.1 hypothetical protein E5K02_10360 [Hymenobacter metallicola]
MNTPTTQKFAYAVNYTPSSGENCLQRVLGKLAVEFIMALQEKVDEFRAAGHVFERGQDILVRIPAWPQVVQFDFVREDAFGVYFRGEIFTN